MHASKLLTFQPSALASIGALITILSLAFDTFAQQVLSLRTRSIIVNTSLDGNSLPRASQYTNEFDGENALLFSHQFDNGRRFCKHFHCRSTRFARCLVL